MERIILAYLEYSLRVNLVKQEVYGPNGEQIYIDELISHLIEAFNITEELAVDSIEIWNELHAPQLGMKFWYEVAPIHNDLFGFEVHRHYPSTVASDLIAVQPLSGPTSQLFYFDATYSG